MQALTGMDISAMLSFMHHAANLASHKVSAGVSGQWGFPDTWSSTSRFSMKRKPI